MMMTGEKRLAAVLGVWAILVAVGCSSQRENEAMTPEQARQKLISEMTTVIESLVPGAEVKTFVRGTDLACGGPVGTEHNRVRSSIVMNANLGINATDAEGVAKTRTPLEDKGWKIGWNRKYGEMSHFSIEKPDTGSGLLMVNPRYIVFNGETLCVDNPDR